MVTEIYIGSCCNFSKRKAHHKWAEKHTNTYVYEFIRGHGGFENWSMVQLLKFCCNGKREKETKEREFIELLKPALNQVVPTRTIKEYNDSHKEDHHQYYEEHKEANKAKVVDVVCECGIKYRGHAARHKKSKHHINFFNQEECS